MLITTPDLSACENPLPAPPRSYRPGTSSAKSKEPARIRCRSESRMGGPAASGEAGRPPHSPPTHPEPAREVHSHPAPAWTTSPRVRNKESPQRGTFRSPGRETRCSDSIRLLVTILPNAWGRTAASLQCLSRTEVHSPRKKKREAGQSGSSRHSCSQQFLNTALQRRPAC